MSDQSTPATRTPVTLPTQDQEPGVQTDDFGLKPSLQETIAAALEQRWTDPDAPPTTVEDEAPSEQAPGEQAPVTQPAPAPAEGAPPAHPGIPSDADTAATPAPAPSPGASQGGAGDGGDALGDGAAPDPTAPPSPAPTAQEEFDLREYARQYFGQDIDAAQARQLFGLLGGLQNLTPDKRAYLDQYLASGGTVAPPIPQPPLDLQSTSHARGPETPTQIPGLPPRPDDEYEAQIYDKLIAPFAATIQQQLGGMQQEIAQSTQQRLEQERQRSVEEIRSTQDTWRAAHPVISDGEFDALTDRIIRSQQFPALVAAVGPAAATNQILDQFFWADETLRNRALANVASGREAGSGAPDPNSPAAQAATEADRQRQARAASVSGGGGAPTTHTPKEPATKEERRDGMIRELEAQMQGG